MDEKDTVLRQHHDRIRDQYSSLISIFSSEVGQLAMKTLVDEFVNETTFSSDPYLTAFKEGQRAMILQLKDIVALGD